MHRLATGKMLGVVTQAAAAGQKIFDAVVRGYRGDRFTPVERSLHVEFFMPGCG
jgi:hypothetical protein